MKPEMEARPAEEVRDWILEQQFRVSRDLFLTPGEKGALIGHMNDAWGSDSNRRACLAWLFPNGRDERSTKELDEGQWVVLMQWIKPWQDDDGVWRPTPRFEAEAQVIMVATSAWLTKLYKDEARADLSMVNHASQMGGKVRKVVDSGEGLPESHPGVMREEKPPPKKADDVLSDFTF